MPFVSTPAAVAARAVFGAHVVGKPVLGAVGASAGDSA